MSQHTANVDPLIEIKGQMSFRGNICSRQENHCSKPACAYTMYVLLIAKILYAVLG